MKSIKSLFIKDENEDEQPQKSAGTAFKESNTASQHTFPSSSAGANPHLAEIIQVYEKGLESINMPGYDFYDFFLAVKAAGSQNEAIYKMAFQMGRSMDGTVSAEKLAADAEYYISKINEVHRNYSDKGGDKLKSLESELRADKDNLSREASHIETSINKMKQEIASLEQKLTEVRNNLSKSEGKYKPQQEAIRQKLLANDQAMQVSIQNLTQVREGIIKYVK